MYTSVLPGEEVAYSTERSPDVARALAEIGHGIAIRIYGKHTGWLWSKGNLIAREFARWSRVSVMSEWRTTNTTRARLWRMS